MTLLEVVYFGFWCAAYVMLIIVVHQALRIDRAIDDEPVKRSKCEYRTSLQNEMIEKYHIVDGKFCLRPKDAPIDPEIIRIAREQIPLK